MIAVDTSAVMAVLLGEAGCDHIIQCLADNQLCMSAGTLSELLIVTAARQLTAPLDQLLDGLGMEIVVVDSVAARGVQQAFLGFGKGRHKASLNFGDCFAYTLAKTRNIPLLFTGNDFPHTDVGGALEGEYEI